MGPPTALDVSLLPSPDSLAARGLLALACEQSVFQTVGSVQSCKVEPSEFGSSISQVQDSHPYHLLFQRLVSMAESYSIVRMSLELSLNSYGNLSSQELQVPWFFRDWFSARRDPALGLRNHFLPPTLS